MTWGRGRLDGGENGAAAREHNKIRDGAVLFAEGTGGAPGSQVDGEDLAGVFEGVVELDERQSPAVTGIANAGDASKQGGGGMFPRCSSVAGLESDGSGGPFGPAQIAPRIAPCRERAGAARSRGRETPVMTPTRGVAKSIQSYVVYSACVEGSAAAGSGFHSRPPSMVSRTVLLPPSAYPWSVPTK